MGYPWQARQTLTADDLDNTIALLNTQVARLQALVSTANGTATYAQTTAQQALTTASTALDAVLADGGAGGGTIFASTITPGYVQIGLNITVQGQGVISLTGANVIAALGYTPVNAALVGAANGLAQLDATGLVPVGQLPATIPAVDATARAAAAAAQSTANAALSTSTAAATYAPITSVASVVAAGSIQATAPPVSAAVNVITSVPLGSGVTLQFSVGVPVMVVQNQGVNPLLVYPAGSGQIGTNAAGAPVEIAVGDVATFARTSASTCTVY